MHEGGRVERARLQQMLAWFEEHAVPKSKRPRPIAVALALLHLGARSLPLAHTRAPQGRLEICRLAGRPIGTAAAGRRRTHAFFS